MIEKREILCGKNLVECGQILCSSLYENAPCQDLNGRIIGPGVYSKFSAAANVCYPKNHQVNKHLTKQKCKPCQGENLTHCYENHFRHGLMYLWIDNRVEKNDEVGEVAHISEVSTDENSKK